MSQEPKMSRGLFTLLFAGGVLLVLSIIPIWQGPNTYKNGDNFASSNLWTAAHYLATYSGDESYGVSPSDMIGLFLRNLGILAVILTLGAVSGHVIYRAKWDRKTSWHKTQPPGT